jgi:hypothetical protein
MEARAVSGKTAIAIDGYLTALKENGLGAHIPTVEAMDIDEPATNKAVILTSAKKEADDNTTPSQDKMDVEKNAGTGSIVKEPKGVKRKSTVCHAPHRSSA